MRMINVRHPFARILSAWRQKFGKDFWNLGMYVRKYGKSISKFEEINYENENVFSFRAFLEYIVAVAEINQFDYHWKTMDFEVCKIDKDCLCSSETQTRFYAAREIRGARFLKTAAAALLGHQS